jgi:hypothetical protein
MNTLKLITGACAVVLFATSASAVTITNRDARTYQLKVLEGDRSEIVALQPNAEIRDLCATRCQVTIDGEEEPYELEVADKVEIEEGQLYFADETPQDPAAPNNN